jgi:transposase
MEKFTLKNYLIEGMSLNQISKKEKKSLTTVRYWVKKYELSPNFESIRYKKIIDYGEKRKCPKCNQDCNISQFYNRRGKEYGSVYCKQCTNKQTLERQRNLKNEMIQYKGGKCEMCGYNKYSGALEFHHLNPSEKEFNLSNLKSYKFDEVIKNELDKCSLLCSNCHREIHRKKW